MAGMAALTPALHVVGAGRAGRAIARVLISTGRVQPGWIVNHTSASTRTAAAFLGGTPAAAPGRVEPQDWLLLGLPDSLLESVAAELAAVTSPPAVVCHLSGAMPAGVLSPIGAPAAAVHPVRPFTDPQRAVTEFAGTWCVASGDDEAVRPLLEVLELAGGRGLRIAETHRPLYHAATVAASNYLVTLTGLARELAARAGLPAEAATAVLADLEAVTLAGLRDHTPAAALTGPVERGDIDACRRLTAAVDAADAERGTLFRALGRATVEIARIKHPDRCDWRAMAAVFEPPEPTSRED